MSVSGQALSRISFGSFYLPAIGFGYLATKQSVVYHEIAGTNLLGFVFGPTEIFLFLSGISFLGAIQAHGIAVSVYGWGGPEENHKHDEVFVRELIATGLGIKAERVPIIVARAATNGLSISFLEYVKNRALLFRHRYENPRNLANPLKPRPARSHWFTDFIQKAAELHPIVIRQPLRIIYFVPMASLKLLASVSFSLYLILALTGPFQSIVLLLLAAHFVLIHRSSIWADFHELLYEERAENRFTPEYNMMEKSKQMTEKLGTEQVRKRKRRPSIRYRK